jgi:hypothetical protein
MKSSLIAARGGLVCRPGFFLRANGAGSVRHDSRACGEARPANQCASRNAAFPDSGGPSWPKVRAVMLGSADRTQDATRREGMLAMPALLAPPGDVHRVAGAMFTISCSLAVITPVLSGLAWDLTGACAVLLIVLAPTTRFGKVEAR